MNENNMAKCGSTVTECSCITNGLSAILRNLRILTGFEVFTAVRPKLAKLITKNLVSQYY